MHVLVGLGNPGENYQNTRHNIGFMAIDQIADQYGASAFRLKFSAATSGITLEGKKVILCKPLTYMNLSGRSVQQLIQFYKVPPENVIVFHDDVDLQPGQIKVKQAGGHGGHNGLRSLDSTIGKNYWRVRLGVGHPGYKDAVAGYVLKPFAKSDAQWLALNLQLIAEYTPLLFKEPQRFLNDIAKNKQSNLS